jgi:hypothetical protein
MVEKGNRLRRFDRRALAAIGITTAFCWLFTFLAVNVFGDYAWGLFIWLPIVLGATSTLIYGFRNPRVKNRLFSISFFTLVVYSLGLLAFAWEGLICLLMAFPIGLLLTWTGHLLGHGILKAVAGKVSSVIVLLFLSVPLLMAFEHATKEEDRLRAITTSIVIEASPDQVWKAVIAFPPLKEPTEFVFKTGIAYPINATIKGSGVGAVRHCNFSTGSFVEPITVWEEPRLLKFSVVEQPEPMKELSPYTIRPAHLHGYWVSKEGQFRLIRLGNGHTLLEGTTWYVNKIKPDFYWAIWSDYIVHKIHQRVLAHIKAIAEQ